LQLSQSSAALLLLLHWFNSASRPHSTGKTTYAAAYWGYMVPAHLLSLAAGVMHFSKLLLVFDLDETLLMAHTVDSLAQRIRRVNATR
jgi:hypothetical protein